MANGRKRTRKFKIPFWSRERISKDTHLEFFSTLRQTKTKSTRKTRRIPDASSDLSVIFFFEALTHHPFSHAANDFDDTFFEKNLCFSHPWQRLVQQRWFVVVRWNDFANNRAFPFFFVVIWFPALWENSRPFFSGATANARRVVISTRDYFTAVVQKNRVFLAF